MSRSADTDAARFEALYREHYPAVLRYAARRTDRAGAEEIAAETFAIAWQRLAQFLRGDPLPWLLVTARNTLANQRRSAARAEEKTRAHAAKAEPRSRDPAEALAERDAAVLAFTALSERDREALRLVAWDGLALADAARVAGTTRIAFAARVSRARRRLAAAFEAPGEGEESPSSPPRTVERAT